MVQFENWVASSASTVEQWIGLEVVGEMKAGLADSKPLA